MSIRIGQRDLLAPAEQGVKGGDKSLDFIMDKMFQQTLVFMVYIIVLRKLPEKFFI